MGRAAPNTSQLPAAQGSALPAALHVLALIISSLFSAAG